MAGPCQLCGRRPASWSDGVCSPCAARHPLRAGTVISDVDVEHGVITLARADDAQRFSVGQTVTMRSTPARLAPWHAYAAGVMSGGLVVLVVLLVARCA